MPDEQANLEPLENVEFTDDEHLILGTYTDILVQKGVVKAGEYLDSLPSKPRQELLRLTRTARLLDLAAHGPTKRSEIEKP